MRPSSSGLRTRGRRLAARSALAVHVPSLLVLTAVLHLMEGLLVRRQGARLALPLFLESKRGKLVGGYQLQGFWPVPLVMLVPTGGGPLTLPWEPLFSGGQGPAGWSLLAFPAIIGFSQLTTAYLPKDKLRQSSGLLWAYALAVAALAGLAGLWEPLGLLGAGLAALLHEAMIRYGSREEDRKQPLYVHDGRGMHILAVLPNSAAQEAGLQAGEIVHRVNGVRVRSKEEFHDALRINPAFCKLEVLNHEGHSKFVSRALYADAHHQLGLILSPDDRAPFFLSEKPPGFASYLRMKWSGMRRNDKARSDFESFS
ncbi:PDZ domain-containing protein [Paenibacillus sp. CC-CFT747]|nr:PDZ domain-containing protein [Paenibacillus sp. CC-CFT747]